MQFHGIRFSLHNRFDLIQLYRTTFWTRYENQKVEKLDGKGSLIFLPELTSSIDPLVHYPIYLYNYYNLQIALILRGIMAAACRIKKYTEIY